MFKKLYAKEKELWEEYWDTKDPKQRRRIERLMLKETDKRIRFLKKLTNILCETKT